VRARARKVRVSVSGERACVYAFVRACVQRCVRASVGAHVRNCVCVGESVLACLCCACVRA